MSNSRRKKQKGKLKAKAKSKVDEQFEKITNELVSGIEARDYESVGKKIEIYLKQAITMTDINQRKRILSELYYYNAIVIFHLQTTDEKTARTK